MLDESVASAKVIPFQAPASGKVWLAVKMIGLAAVPCASRPPASAPLAMFNPVPALNFTTTPGWIVRMAGGGAERNGLVSAYTFTSQVTMYGLFASVQVVLAEILPHTSVGPPAVCS